MKTPQNTGPTPEHSATLVAKLAASGMQNFVDGSMDAIISIDAQMRIVLFNPAATRIFGMSIDDAVGRPIEDFIPERFRARHGSHVHNFGLNEHTSRKMGLGGQIIGLRANGEEFPAKASISRFEIDGHAVFNVFLRDVTNQVKIQKALDQSSTELEETNRMLARTAAMAKVGGWELDLLTTVVTFSEVTAQLHEVDHPYIPPKLSQGDEFYPAHAWPMIKAAVDAAIAFGTPYDLESPFITAKGRHLWVRVQGFPVREGGKTIKLQGTFQDITERIHAQESTRALAERLALAARAGGIGIWDYDVVNNTLLWDDAMYNLYGISVDQFGGAYEAWQAGVHPDDRARGDEEIQATLQGNKAYDTEFRVLWPRGEVRTIRAIASVQRDDQGNPVRMVGTNWDITEQKLAEETLQSSVKEKSALIKEVHHRVKNNLQVITSLLRMEASRSLVADTKDVLGYMRGRIRTMAQLHESLYRSGTFASVDLGVYLGQVATQAFKTQELNPDSVRLNLSLGSVQSGMDQAQAAGLLLNELISNCLKHGFPEGQTGEVSVALQPAHDQDNPPDGRWCLRVSDTGVGLVPDFEDKRKASLGLQLVTDLSHQLGGTLEVDSVPGAGARFQLVFTVLTPAALVMPP